MGVNKSSKVLLRTFPYGAWVKPGGQMERAVPPIANLTSQSPILDTELMELVCQRSNLQQALERVKANKGSAGVDGLSVKELPAFLREHWSSIKEQILLGTYKPLPVKRVEIPKPGSQEKRKLGIPSVLDRFLQQAILQVLQPQWDSTFSEHSFGFRPNRSAHQAVAQAQNYLKVGNNYVVDIDLEKFFDRVNHDRLMSRLAERIKDKRMLKLIRAFLEAGVMENGLVSASTEGTPQGGPLSPFLSNVVLDELDKELEGRNHCFVRYADDCNIYVKSQRAGLRVMASVSHFIAQRLKLKVNEQKSAVGQPKDRKFLGFTFTGGKFHSRRKIALQSLQRFRAKVRQITRRNKGQSVEEVIRQLKLYVTGWRGYYGFCETPSVLEELDSWIRSRLRCLIVKQLKTYSNRKAVMIQAGVPIKLATLTACSSKGPWRVSHSKGFHMALNCEYFDKLGLVKLVPI
jgi:RNA-directed DNA polymerase